jgi:predicted Zn-dependent protease with MMP-like domain
MPAERLHLPSGAQFELDSELAPAVGGGGLFAADIAAFRGRLFATSGDVTGIQDLSLADFHTLRAILRRLGRIVERATSVVCDNCDRRFDVRACDTLELGPYRDGELDDAELDAAFDFAAAHDVAGLGTVRLAPLTLARARALHEALARPRFRLTSRVVTAMGIVELAEETDPRRIARKLSSATQEEFDEVCELFERAHYPARLVTPHNCPECGVVTWVFAPALREFSSELPPDAEHLRPPSNFMSVDEFERLVRDEAERAYSELRVAQVDLVVVEGPAEHDDGGEPLLGCYEPADPDALPPRPHEIRIFYRTFANAWADDGPYDVASEVRETLLHELEHHLAHLAGSDSVDEDEHAEIEREIARRVGRQEVLSRALRGALGDVAEFARRTWLLWLAVLIATLLALAEHGRQ